MPLTMSAAPINNVPYARIPSTMQMNEVKASAPSRFLGLFPSNPAPVASLATARASAQMKLGSTSGVNSLLGINAGLARAQA